MKLKILFYSVAIYLILGLLLTGCSTGIRGLNEKSNDSYLTIEFVRN